MRNPKVSVIIPTYNRSKDLEITLKSIRPFIKILNEVLIIDQSNNDETKNIVKRLNNPKIKYLYSRIPSITIARNLGIKNTSKGSDIICFIDDDATLKEGYFKSILKVFEDYPHAKAVAGYNRPEESGLIENFFKKIFFLGSIENRERARIISAYGNTYPKKLTKIINSQWLPGVNMAYRKEVFSEQKFDENLLGYTIGEDIDFSYRLWKKHPDSLFITPFAKLTHRASTVERYPTEKMSYVNQIDHFYFNYKNLNNDLRQKIVFIWSLLGIIFLRTGALLSFKKINYIKWKYFFKSLFYCLSNTKKIKSGRLREF